jgi:hypothetical protein
MKEMLEVLKDVSRNEESMKLLLTRRWSEGSMEKMEAMSEILDGQRLGGSLVV